MTDGYDASGETPSLAIAQCPDAGVRLEPRFSRPARQGNLSAAATSGLHADCLSTQAQNVAASVIMSALPCSIVSVR